MPSPSSPPSSWGGVGGGLVEGLGEGLGEGLEEGLRRRTGACPGASSGASAGGGAQSPLIFVTPELGRFSAVGGLGVMVDHLTAALASRGAPVTVITPAYASCAASWASQVRTLAKLEIPFVESRATLTLMEAKHGSVRVLFLCSPGHFQKPYERSASVSEWILPPILLARGALLAIHLLGLRPKAVVSNDWVCALVAPYARHGKWWPAAAMGMPFVEAEKLWHDAPFVHLIHNLEPGYDGCMALSGGRLAQQRQLETLHQLPAHLLLELGPRLNLSRAALLCSNQWATVSHGYREQLLRATSPALAPLLRSFSAPFACASGLPLSARRRALGRLGGHAAAKATLQARCFGNEGVRPAVPLLCFLGRIAHQKGVHLLLECVPALLRGCAGQVQLLVCGQADPGDAYAARCTAQIRELRAAYPLQFWASPPGAFFEEGLLVSLGADWGVMPSVFEPCGLVREEFFAAGTPVVCADTGGMSERVRVYDELTREGSGLLFRQSVHQELLGALECAMRLFSQPKHAEALRRNAHAAACHVAHTAWNWHCELHRLRACLALQQQQAKIEQAT